MVWYLKIMDNGFCKPENGELCEPKVSVLDDFRRMLKENGLH